MKSEDKMLFDQLPTSFFLLPHLIYLQLLKIFLPAHIPKRKCEIRGALSDHHRLGCATVKKLSKPSHSRAPNQPAIWPFILNLQSLIPWFPLCHILYGVFVVAFLSQKFLSLPPLLLNFIPHLSKNPFFYVLFICHEEGKKWKRERISLKTSSSLSSSLKMCICALWWCIFLFHLVIVQNLYPHRYSTLSIFPLP